jgi:glycolate oxidase FAD binding subunit
MTDAIKARDARDVEQAVQWALAEGKTLELIGAGSKRAIGRPSQTDVSLDLSRLCGISLYEPEELVLSARAGTSLAEIEALVASKGQQLAFEPMDCGPILGRSSAGATLGGTLATNLSGPRRIKAGAARDHFLGFTAVSGRGESFKSGGRVVKNVTGYDLCKLIAGSWGTLAAMTEVTIKTLPAPETQETLLLRGLAPQKAIAAMTAAIASDCDVSGAAHLPAGLAARVGVREIAGAADAVTALRVEGFAPSVAHRLHSLETLLKSFGESARADPGISRALWRAIRDVAPFASSGEVAQRPLWRISTVASRGAELAAAVAKELDSEVLFDWSGGLLWLCVGETDDAGAAVIGRAVAAVGGHATLMRAPSAVRAAVAVFSPQDPVLAALTRRVKEGFDPKRVLNPGRMWAGL